MFSNDLPAWRQPPGVPGINPDTARILILAIAILLTAVPQTGAQEYYSTRSVVVEDLIEMIARDSEEELDYHTLFQDIYNYLEEPLNINAATRDELEKLHLLTDFQIISLQNYVAENGAVLSIYELPLVYGFNESLARTIEPLIELGPPQRAMPAKRKSSHQLFMRVSSVLEEQQGYSDIPDSIMAAKPNSAYPGNRLRLMTKYRYKWGNKILIGYNGDKDAGEQFFSGDNTQGFDFNSAYIRINDVWKFKSIMLGDYQVKTGQGLSLWSGLAFGKSPDILNIRKKGKALNHYNSVDENRFMRGVSATVGLGDFDLTGFISYKNIDANMLDDTLTGNRMFSSFQSSGYHRTAAEIADQDAVRETIAGGNVIWNTDRLRLGATFLHYFYDAEYNRNYSTGSMPGGGMKSNTNIGADYSVGLQRLSLFGEVSYSVNSAVNHFTDKWAILNGASFQLHPQVSMSVLHRYLGAGFYARYGNAFRENSRNSNENGIYTGIEVLPLPHWKITAYLDAYSFPFLTKLIADGHSGFDYHIQADYTERDQLSGYLRYRYKTRPSRINSGGSMGPDLAKPRRSQLRFHISYTITEALVFQNRIELSFYDETVKESGWLAYHDIIYKPPSFPLSFSFRYAMFDTESYDTRIYTYEHDVLYAFAIPSWYGRGIRTYLNTRLKLGRHVDIWFKYALSWYPERETISSGLNEIVGHHKQDINVQLRLKF